MVYRLSNPVLLLNGVATALWYVITAGSGQPFFCPNNAHKIVIIMAENQIIALTVQEAQEMYELVMAKNGQAVTSSLIVARYFKKEHSDVLKTIRKLDCSDNFRAANFGVSCYTKTNGNVTKSYPMYYMTRDGFTFLAMGFTGRVAAQVGNAYMDGYFFAGQYRKAQEVIKRLNNVVDNYRDIVGELNAAITSQHDQAKRMQEQLLKSQEHTCRLLDIMAKKMK